MELREHAHSLPIVLPIPWGDAGLETMSLPGTLGVAEVTRVMEAGGDLQPGFEQTDVARMGEREQQRLYDPRCLQGELPSLPLQALRSVMALLRSR